MSQCLFKRRVDIATWKTGLRATEHDVAAVGQCALGQRLEGASPHDDGVARGESLKPFEVIRQPIDQFVVVADGAVGGNGGNDAYHK